MKSVHVCISSDVSRTCIPTVSLCSQGSKHVIVLYCISVNVRYAALMKPFFFPTWM